MIDPDKIKARLAELTAQRQTYMNEANRQLAYFDGAIVELQRLIQPPQPTTPEEKQSDNGN